MLFKIKKFFKFVKIMIDKFGEKSLPAIAAQVTYFIVLSFFPFLIFLVSLLSYVNLTEFASRFYTLEVLPSVVIELITTIVNNVVDKQSYTLLSTGMLLAIWSSSSGVVALMTGICNAYGQENRPFITLRILSIVYTIVFTLIIIIAITLLVLGEQIGKYLFSLAGIGSDHEIIWDIVRYSGAACLLTILFILLFSGIPCGKIRIKSVIPGAVITAIGWIILSSAFSFYINNFTRLSYTYGSLGAVFALLLWLYWSCILVLAGNLFNAVRMHKAD